MVVDRFHDHGSCVNRHTEEERVLIQYRLCHALLFPFHSAIPEIQQRFTLYFTSYILKSRIYTAVVCILPVQMHVGSWRPRPWNDICAT